MIQPDGKLVVSGESNAGGSSVYNALLLRYNTSGTLDSTFNGTGSVIVPFGTSSGLLGLTLQSDGKIVATGYTSGTGGGDVLLMRFTTARALMPPLAPRGSRIPTSGYMRSPGRSGSRPTARSSWPAIPRCAPRRWIITATSWSCAIPRAGHLTQPGGRAARSRLTSSTMARTRSHAVAIQADGKVVAAGYANINSFGLARYLGDAPNSSPTANAGGPYTVPEGGSVTLDGSQSTDPNQPASTLNYQWDLNGNGIFGETGTAATRGDETGINPTFSAAGLDGPGSYSVALRVTNNSGLTSTSTATISITNVPPTVNPIVNAQAGEGHLYSQSGTFTDPGPDTWKGTVDYGDGSGVQTLTLAPGDKRYYLSHDYVDEGTFNVTVTITDKDGGVGTARFSISVLEVPPVVNAGSSITLSEGGTLSRAGNFSDPAWDSPWTATVDYGDGSGPQPLSYNANYGFSLNHAYADEGSYAVTVSVADNEGTVGSGSFTVTVVNAAPVVNAGTNATINEGAMFGGTGSFTDPTSDTWTGTVNYGDGSGVQPLALNPDKSFNLSHAYADEGNYTVQVTVTDDDGLAGSGSFVVTAKTQRQWSPPGRTPSSTKGATFGGAGSFTDPASDTWTGTVNYGDGSDVQPLALNPDKSFNLSHAYADEGNYTVQVTVTDDDGMAGVASFTITAQNVNPIVSAGANQTLNEGDVLGRIGTFADGSTDKWTATVNYGDGSGTQPLTLNGDKTFVLNHLYADEGTYAVVVMVADDAGATGTASFSVTALNVSPTVNAGRDLTLNEGDVFGRNGSFADPGTDTWIATVDYGDGSGSQPLTLNADKTFSIGHVYGEEGSYTVRVAVTDDDGIRPWAALSSRRARSHPRSVRAATPRSTKAIPSIEQASSATPAATPGPPLSTMATAPVRNRWRSTPTRPSPSATCMPTKEAIPLPSR